MLIEVNEAEKTIIKECGCDSLEMENKRIFVRRRKRVKYLKN